MAQPAPVSRYPSYLNDGDNDAANDNDPDDHDGSNIDDDHDYSEDHQDPENGAYQDRDDLNSIAAYGRPANVAETRAIAVVLGRYYAVAASGDGVKACTMIAPALAHSVAEDYGQSPGPVYLRGKTCGVVLSKLFRHSIVQLSAPPKVTGVRVQENHAFALLGSAKAPASGIELERERGVWRVNAMLWEPLP